MNYIRITKDNIDKEHICCAMSGKQSLAKKEWMKQRFDEGLVFYRSEERGKCFIEYIPAENAWVPIDAAGYLYINCLWIAGSMKGHGYANDLLAECLRDAAAQGRKGICILSAEGRKREFLSDAKFLAHKGFVLADTSDCGITLFHPFLFRNAAVSAARAGRRAAEIPGLREAPRRFGKRLHAVLYRPVSVHVLLGAAGAGNGEGTRHPSEGHPHHRPGDRAERPGSCHDLCALPRREIRDARHPVRQKISRACGRGGISTIP